MGVDDLYYESLERGWDAPTKFVCPNCVNDDFLKGLINANLKSTKCSYCGKKGKKFVAAPVETIMPAISSGIHYYFNDPDSACIPIDGGDWALDLPTSDTEDAFNFISLDCNPNLFNEITASFSAYNDVWVKTSNGHWAGMHDSDSMAYAWDRFVRTVKHECRYFFFKKEVEEYSDEIPPIAILETVRRMAIDFRLLVQLPLATELFRVRARDSGAVWKLNAQELGPPPNKQAHAGRMNPVGISYFYLGKNPETALAEVVVKHPCKVILAKFKTRQDLLLLDLCNLPTLPSIFDEHRHQEREMIYFLLHFVGEISQPVPKNGQEHIDYVPSQIISEYFAKEFRTTDGQSINGLLYPSTVKPGGTNVVLFPPPEGYRGFTKLADFIQAEEIAMADWNRLIE